MMMFLHPISLLGGAAAILSFSSMSNMAETYRAAMQHHDIFSGSARTTSTANAVPNVTNKVKKWKSIDEGLEELRKMSRRELIQLYLELECDDCTLKPFSDAKRDKSYDGYLLDNGPVLTHVTNFITNKLFGQGQKWLGKVYLKSDGNNTISKGQNRFMGKNNGERLDRTFDCYIDQSALSARATTHHASVIINDYSKHCPKWLPVSLIWGGMVDELRVIPVPKSRRKQHILLGMGYFNWSGGVWNAAPFCLVSQDL